MEAGSIVAPASSFPFVSCHDCIVGYSWSACRRRSIAPSFSSSATLVTSPNRRHSTTISTPSASSSGSSMPSVPSADQNRFWPISGATRSAWRLACLGFKRGPLALSGLIWGSSAMIACCTAGAGARQRSSKACGSGRRSERASTGIGGGGSAAAGAGEEIWPVWTKTAATVHAHHRAPEAMASLVGKIGCSIGCILAPRCRTRCQQITRPGSTGARPYQLTFLAMSLSAYSLSPHASSPLAPARARRRCA